MGAGERKHESGDSTHQGKPWRFEVDPRAEEDLVRAIGNYELEREGLGERFHDAVRDMYLRILNNPFQYQAKSKDHRKATLDVFPFALYYCVSEAKHLIVVTSVHHAKRSPRQWMRRKPNWRA